MPPSSTAAPSFGVEVSPIDPRDGKYIERAITAFARGSNGGVIVTASGSADIRRKLIITLAAQHRLPVVYPYRFYAADGGLISYGPDVLEQFRLGAGYVDRIIKGEKPADLPVQAPTKLRTSDQSQDCQNTRSHGAAVAARAAPTR